MRFIQVLVFLSICITCFSQKTNFAVEYDEKIDHTFFRTTDSIYNPLTLVFKDDKGITHYDGVPDSNKYAVQSNCIINNDPETRLRFGNAFYRNDSLIVRLYELGPAELINLEIIIYKEKLSAEFSYATPALGIATMKLKSINLIIDQKQFKKGDLLKGNVSFKSICKQKCGRKTIEGNGYFKMIIE